MIISCENCNKKFELEDSLIPAEGRILQCGSCSHQWHYKPQVKENLVTKKDTEVETPTKEEEINNKVEVTIKPIESLYDDNEDEEINDSKKNANVKPNKKISYFNYFLVIIFSFLALIILVDTFETKIFLFFPKINLYLDSLYQSLTDIYLFFKDLS